VWGFVGEIPVTVTGPGLLTHPAGTAQLQSPYAGLVSTMLVRPPEKVAKGQSVARVERTDGTVATISSPFSGQVVGASVTDGHVVGVGDVILAVERTDGPDDRLVAMLFVPADQALGIVPGRTVDVAVSTAPAAAYGVLQGRVTSISDYPLTTEAVAGLVGGPATAAGYTQSGPPKLVIVDLLKDAGTASGYAWSTQSGPPFPLASQVRVTATIILSGRSPINLLLGR
jgi:pyruvate/2-oxoglutarate dehydrogenase complex dihydrolipoamide acyltransferase (E2) component